MRGRAAAAALPAFVVVGLVAVVAIAATGSTPGGSNETRPPSETILDTLFSLGLVAVVAGGILVLYGLTQRRAIATEIASKRYPRMSLLGFLVLFGAFTALTGWRMSKWQTPEPPPEEGDLVSPGERLPRVPEVGATYEPSVSWIPIVVVVGLVVAGVVAYVVAERRRTRGSTAEDVLAEQLALALDDSLDDLRAETDPRRAIVAAYARLEHVLGANGVPRLASETADEYLPRVLRNLEIDPAAVSRLTTLFTRAKFSPHEIDASMKEEAIGALGDVRDELRGLRERAAGGGEATLSAVGAPS